MKNFSLVSSVCRVLLLLATATASAHCAQVDGYESSATDSGRRISNSHDASTTTGDGGASDSPIMRGEMYVASRHCAACHQSSNPADGILSGSLTAIPGSPSGVVGYGPNLTPDTDTGIGGWTDEQIIRAMRMGLDAEGASMCVMPKFTDMGEDEAADIVAYLRSLPPIARTVTDSTCPDDLMPATSDEDSGMEPARDASISITDPGMPDSGMATDSGVAPVDSAAPPTDSGVAPSCTPVLVINEIQTAGTGGAGDEFVELYNDSDCVVSLTGYELKYASATGTTSSRRWIGVMGDHIAAHGYALIAGMGFSGGVTPIGVFATTTGTLSATGGGIGLFSATGTLIDSVGYGTSATNPLVEGTPASAPPSAQSIARTPNGHDTNANGADFALAMTPTPGAANR